jgi:hypothetical protein
MKTETRALQRLRSMIAPHAAGGIALRTDFFALSDFVRGSADTEARAPGGVQRLRTRQFMVASNVGSMLALLSRVDWMRKQALLDDYANSMWRTYTGLDIESFHVYLRASMDYISDMLTVLASKPDQVGDKKAWSSYEKLLNWEAKSPGNRSRLGVELADLVFSSTQWFSAVCLTRDEIIHRGARTLVFGDPQDGTLFQVHRAKFQAIIKGNEFLAFKDDVIHFDRYAVLHLAHLVGYLDDLSGIVRRQFTGSLGPSGNVYLASDGLQVVADWIDGLLAVLGSDDKEDMTAST